MRWGIASVAVVMGGCSLVFSGSDYVGHGGPGQIDAGTDAGTDAGSDATVGDVCPTERQYSCDGQDAVVTCAGQPGELSREACPLGCDADAGVCVAVVPSFVSDPNAAIRGTAHIRISAGQRATWDVDTGKLTVGGDTLTVEPILQEQGGMVPDLAVLAVADLTVEEKGSLSFVGTRAVAVVARGAIVVAGTVSASAEGPVGGPGGASSSSVASDPIWPMTGMPGGFDSFEVPPTTTTVAKAHTGGGGGSNGASGGAAGSAFAKNSAFSGASTSVPRTEAGAVYASQGEPWASHLVGGGAGGTAYYQANKRIRGGGGGGALLLCSQQSIEFGAKGAVNAQGAGGRNKQDVNPSVGGAASGSGGGAGGTIVLEAPTISGQTGAGIYANGGGGAGGDASDGAHSSVGDDGAAGNTRADGGALAMDHDNVASDGGLGGAGTSDDQGGGASSDLTLTASNIQRVLAASGGGGGGAGRIVIHTASGAMPAHLTASPSGNLVTVDTISSFVPTKP